MRSEEEVDLLEVSGGHGISIPRLHPGKSVLS